MRALTAGEWAALSPGLAEALHTAEAAPGIMPRAHIGARIAALWRGHTPILTRGAVIWWADAPADISAASPQAMAVLQHELHHVLEYATGALSAARYILGPRNWSYAWDHDARRPWAALGAEQRAVVAEQLWLAERGLAPAREIPELKRLLPWAD